MQDLESDAIERRYGERVRELRRAAGLSQAGLADALGAAGGARLDPSGIARLERGQRRVALGEAVLIARILATTVDDIIEGRSPAPAQVNRTELAAAAQELAAMQSRLAAMLDRLGGVRSRLARVDPLTEQDIAEATAQAAADAEQDED